ncbi:MAG: sulfotransferase family 2 domain-containing protein [Carbonactinosporaceae bacterium]
MPEMSSGGLTGPAPRVRAPVDPDGAVDAAGSADPADSDGSDGFPYERYIETRTIVLDELKVLFVAVPKAAWTSLLWLLAPSAGLTIDSFVTSGKPEVTLSMAVHDMSIWQRAGRALANFTGDERERVLTEDGWFRFAVVRDPAPKIWSAWQSKLLMREPQYIQAFGRQPWFPRVPEHPADILEDFRTFVAALREHDLDERIREVHWAPQHQLTGRLRLDHVGRVEQLDATLEALRHHLGDRAVELAPLGRDNRMPLPYSPIVYDKAALDSLQHLYDGDFAQFGYPLTEPIDDDDLAADWHDRVADQIPALRELIARHERLAALHDVMTEEAARHRAERRVLAERLGRTRHQRRDLVERGRRQQERISRLDQRVGALTRRNAALQQRLNALTGSLSWRLTRPFRSIRRRARLRWGSRRRIGHR